MRLGVLASHPIQYQAPWFRALAKETDLHVFFAHRQTAVEQGQAGFGVSFDWDVDLLAGYQHRFLENTSRQPGVHHSSGCDTPEIANIIREGRFDAFIVCGWYLKSYLQAVRACRRNRIPVLVRGDSQLRTRSPLHRRCVRAVSYRFLLHQFDGFLFVGQRNREYLENYGVPERKLFFAPHFVDNERFRKQAGKIRNSKFEIRKRWGIPEDGFCVLFCGKYIPKKRPLDLIKAAQLLLSSHPELKPHLLFVGSGELGAEMRAASSIAFDADASEKPDGSVQTSGTEELITDNQKPRASFVGFLNQTEISKAYALADILVLPSDGGETWGLVVNEAMACGLPAIVSDAVGCGPDVIEEGKTGFTFPLCDSAILARRLGTGARMTRDGHDFAPALTAKMRQYSLEEAVAGTLRAVEKVARSKNS